MVQEIILSRSLRSALFQLSFSCLPDFTNVSFLPLNKRWNFKKAKYRARPAGLLLWPCPHQLSPQGFCNLPSKQEAGVSCWSSCCFSLLLYHQCFLDSSGTQQGPVAVPLAWLSGCGGFSWTMSKADLGGAAQCTHVCTTALLNLAG